MNRIYIPELWIEEDNSSSTNYQSWTTNYITRELSTFSATFLKIDGTNKPSSNIDFNQNSLVNLKSGINSSDAITKSYVDTVYNTFEPVFDKSKTTIFPILGQSVTSNTSHAIWASPVNAFDNDNNTQWIIAVADVLKFNWIQVELLNAIQIWKVLLSPRNGLQKLTHVFNDYYLEGSIDGIIYTRIFESKLVINQTRIFEFNITPKYRFFKFTGTGLLQCGLSGIDLFEAKTYEVKVSAGNGIELNSNNALKLENTVPKFIAIFQPNLIENLPILGYDAINNSYWITNSSMTIPARNQAISKLTDIIDKQYVDNTFLSKALYYVEQALPGIPITNGLVMSFVPSLKTCTLDANSFVNDITDPITGITLTTGSSAPSFSVDNNQLSYLNFNNNELIKENVSVADIGGSTGKTTTFFFIGTTHKAINQSQFNWMKGVPGNYDTNIRLGVHLPWSNNDVYVDHAAVKKGRLQVIYNTNVSSILGTKSIWSYIRDNRNAYIYHNSANVGTINSLTSSFNPLDVGRFSIGNGNNTSNYSNMRFYGLFFYNRALNNTELNSMHIWLKQYFRI